MQPGELYHEEHGAGIALVLLHGFPFDHTLWKNQLGGLEGWARVMAPDLPGFGQSPALNDEASIAAYCDALALWASSLGLGRFVLAGHSMGGYVAFEFARRYIESLRGLVLIATRPGPDSEQARENRKKQAAAVESASSAQPVVDAMLPKLLAQGTGTEGEAADYLREMMLRQQPAAVIAALTAMAARPDSTPGLEKINVPTLIISGASDQVIPAADAELMAEEIEGATHIAIADAGHALMLEKPDELNEALSNFLSRLESQEV